MRVNVKTVYLAAFIKLSRVIQFVVPVPGKRFLILLKAHRMLLLVVVKLKLRSFLSLDEGFASTNSVLFSPLLSMLGEGIIIFLCQQTQNLLSLHDSTLQRQWNNCICCCFKLSQLPYWS